MINPVSMATKTLPTIPRLVQLLNLKPGEWNWSEVIGNVLLSRVYFHIADLDTLMKAMFARPGAILAQDLWLDAK